MVKSGNKAKRGGGLGGSPSHLMHRVLQLALDIYSEETGADGLTQRQFAVLEAVSHKSGLTQTDLVRATGIDRSTLADLVSRMTVKGLLERERSAIDARAKAVSLSAAGQAALDAARPRVEAADKRILALLPKGKRDGFLALLAELAGEADAAPDKARAEARAAKKAAREAKKAEKLAKKADKPTKVKADKPVKAAKADKPAKAAKLKLVEPT
ncbi:MAG: MarR family transcriptional regulator [Brevundimonas sp.]|uniref:MarR family winged helix-turn-helix transcriptional regulator n=1 Tax=Brevundimonas sp. TaxID=1871086 RepID=UPI0027250AFD|nr:MarR family transcriptional regulator [Brevundimonas sp.]MDO9588821.1 MarR family transcriptional regulator [Brevundimonas sp.]MDP3656752.1 MarR family transcriptional regulator [Brevundimonas sp.]